MFELEKVPLQALILGFSNLETSGLDTAVRCLRFLLRASVDKSLLDVMHTNEKMSGGKKYAISPY